MRSIKAVLVALCLITLVPLTAQAREFRLGLISDKRVEEKIKGYAPWANYVAGRLQAHGVSAGKVVVVKDVEEMIRKLRNKEVDVVLESAFSTLRMSAEAGTKPKLLVWKQGVKQYRTVFFVRKDSGIASLKQLQGRVVSLQDPGSTTAFLIPVAELKRLGLKVVKADGRTPPTAVRYLFSRHEKNQVFYVLKKRAAAGAFGSDNWEEVRQAQKRDLKVIHSTRPVLRYLASFHPDLPDDLADAISRVMVGMDRDPDGRAVLEQASHTRKIEPLSQQDHESLDYVRKLMKSL